jgi:hypothetical protein
VTEIIFTKRAAKPGEVGLFVDSEIWAEEWSSIRNGAQVVAECTVPETAKYRKFFHALVGKIAENCDWLNGDKDCAKEQLLLECRHVTYHVDRLRHSTEIKAKTTKNLSSDQWVRLLRRASNAVHEKFIPGMPENELKREIERMLGDKL